MKEILRRQVQRLLLRSISNGIVKGWPTSTASHWPSEFFAVILFRNPMLPVSPVEISALMP